MALSATVTWAYDFSYTYQGKTLFYTITNNTLHTVRVDKPFSDINYVSGDLVIPDSVINNGTMYAVTSIGNHAFSGTGLTSVIIPSSVTYIDWDAFHGCFLLMTAVVGDGVVTIGPSAFRECISLSSLTLGNSLININEYAFDLCHSLSSLNIPASVANIGFRAFTECDSLSSITVDADNTHYDSRNNCNAIILTDLNVLVQGCNNTVIPNTVTNISNFAFFKCKLASISIPNSVTIIGNNAFSGCSRLTSVTIPNSVIHIGGNAFWECNGLTSVYFLATNPPTLSNEAFYYNAHLYVPCESVTAYQNASGWNNYSSRIHGTPSFDFSIIILPNNELFGSVDIGNANCDSNVTVTTSANTGYQFIGWSDGATGNPRTIHIISDTTITAIFDYITYTIVGQPANTAQGTVTGSDTIYYGDTVILTAVSNYGYHFTRWNDYDTENPRTVLATTDVIYTAFFEPNTYTVTVHSDNTEQGSVSGSGTTNYLGPRTIYATPATGYHFSHWSDGDSNASRTITVTQDTVLTAFFEINSYTLTVLPNVENLGSVTGSGTYTHGSQATVTATPTQGNRFDRWNDNNLLASRTVTMTSNLQLVAVFVPIDTVHVHDTTVLHDTTNVDVPYAVHDTTYINVPYAVHDTTYIDVHDTTYIDVPYAVHDTTIVVDTLTLTEYVPVHDTTILTVVDTMIINNYIYDTGIVVVVDTVMINNYIHDTTYVDVFVHDTTIVRDTTYIDVPYPVHDTTIVVDTLTLTEYVPVHDTTYIDVHDTTYIDVLYPVHDTTVVVDTLTLTEYVPVHDTTYIDVPYPVHDTTIMVDTLTVTDTLWLTQYDTLWMHDTIIIHDTVYITEEGIGGVDALNAKVYSSEGRIVVEGADGHLVTLYDVTGRVLATKQDDYSPLHFDTPASGTYLIKIGAYPARRVVVIR